MNPKIKILFMVFSILIGVSIFLLGIITRKIDLETILLSILLFFISSFDPYMIWKKYNEKKELEEKIKKEKEKQKRMYEKQKEIEKRERAENAKSGDVILTQRAR